MFIQNNVIPKIRRDKFILGGEEQWKRKGELRKEKTIIRKRENRVLLFFYFFWWQKAKRRSLNNQAL